MRARRRRNFLGSLGVCAAAFCAFVTIVSGLLWVGSTLTRSIGIFGLGRDDSLRFRAGCATFERVYAHKIGPGVPEPQWHATAVSRGWTTPGRSPWSFPMFHFSSGHVVGIMSTPGSNIIYPANYWNLDVPLWAIMIPGMIAGPWLAVRWRRSDPTRQPRGFEIGPASSS